MAKKIVKKNSKTAKKSAPKSTIKKSSKTKVPASSIKKTTVKSAKNSKAKVSTVKTSKPKKASQAKTKNLSKTTKKVSSAKPSSKLSSAQQSASRNSRIKKDAAGLKKEISKKAKSKPSKREAARSLAAAALEAAMEEDDEDSPSDDEDEFDPEAFLAASGGKGLIKAHVMRKERVELSLPVRFRFPSSPLVRNGILVNLSKSGLCLESSEHIEEKTVLRIEIPLPHTSELFAIQAEVVWCDHPQSLDTEIQNKNFHVGMTFLPMSIIKQSVINTFIQQRRDELIMAKIGLDKFSESVPVAGLD